MLIPNLLTLPALALLALFAYSYLYIDNNYLTNTLAAFVAIGCALVALLD